MYGLCRGCFPVTKGLWSSTDRLFKVRWDEKLDFVFLICFWWIIWYLHKLSNSQPKPVFWDISNGDLVMCLYCRTAIYNRLPIWSHSNAWSNYPDWFKKISLECAKLHYQWCSFGSFQHQEKNVLRGAVSARVNWCGDCFHHWFEHLVMAQLIVVVGQSFGTNAEKMLKQSSTRTHRAGHAFSTPSWGLSAWTLFILLWHIYFSEDTIGPRKQKYLCSLGSLAKCVSEWKLALYPCGSMVDWIIFPKQADHV